MAQLRNITRSNPQSAFTNAPNSAGDGFRALAGIADLAYDALRPAAIKEQTDLGRELGRTIAKEQMGAGGVAPGGGSTFRAALRASESGGRSDVVNSEGYTGLYQWGPARLADYNRATGQNLTMEQFRGNASVQEAAQDWHEQDIMTQLAPYRGKVVNGQVMDDGALIGMAHLGGVGGAKRYVETGGAANPADSNGTSLADYARKFGGLSVGGGLPAPTTLRDADGNLVSRLYSPLSGEILQAHNAAAAIGYGADILLKSQIDIMALSQQFQSNPAGFLEAAQAYANNLTDQAPAPLRGDIGADLQEEVQRRYLGMIDAQHQETQQRAANSNKALIDRYGDDLAKAVVNGDPREIAAMESRLNGQLRAREAIPGLAWTAEQSENERIAVRDRAVTMREEQVKKQTKEVTEKLDLVIAAAKDCRTSEADSILDDPRAEALAPDAYNEALAFATLCDRAPELVKLPPKVARAQLDAARAVPMAAEWEGALYAAADKLVTENAAAWKADPVQRAQDVLGVPPLQIDPNNPASIIPQLQQRLADMSSLMGGRDPNTGAPVPGYTDDLVLLSKSESEQMSALFGKEVPPELRLAAMTGIVGALGEDAGVMFDQLEGTDPVTLHAGQLLAAGSTSGMVGIEATASKMVNGQAMIDQGVAQVPGKDDFGAVIRDIAGSTVPVEKQGEIAEAARALYAVDGKGGTKPDDAAMRKAVNEAMGQTTTSGKVFGGVQGILNGDVLLPVDVAGEDVTNAIKKAIRPDRDYFMPRTAAWDADPGVWTRAGMPSPPMRDGKQVPGWMVNNLSLRFIRSTGQYRLAYTSPSGLVIDMQTASGAPYDMDIHALAGAAP